jgi:ribonuclease BN (tRNA processing enzyme)
VNDVGPGEVLRHEGWKVTAAHVHHVEPWLRSLAYRVDTDRGSIVFAGDTGPCAQLDDFARGADVFVANCWDHQKTMDGDGEAQGQTGTMDAARFARDSGADVLVLTHTGPSLCRPGSRERAIRDIASVYDGEVVFGDEGMALDLWQHESVE